MRICRVPLFAALLFTGTAAFAQDREVLHND